MDYYVITGTSRGIGAALASELVDSGATVIGISRTASSVGGIQEVNGDLSEIGKLDSLMGRAAKLVDLEKATSITLINNAGVLEPIAPLDACTPEAIDFHLRINLTAPAVLTGAFIRWTSESEIPRQVVNVTSGAARKAYPGWSAYCSAKAGLDMLTRVAASEQREVGGPLRVIAVAPGVVETRMQETIRATDKEKFPHVEKFAKLKEQGDLSDPREAARQIIKVLRDEGVESGAIVDVREYER